MFSIIHPGLFIAGIACIAIPIIIHLLRRKRKPVTWGAMRFLEQAYRKRKRILTIEQLILLATRCALLMLLAAGIGGLILGAKSTSSAPTTLIIALDNAIGSAVSIDSSANSSDLARSKQAALSALDELDSSRGDRAALITLASPARGLIMQPTADLDAVRVQIESTQASDSMIDLPGMIELINAQDIPQEQSIEKLLVATQLRGHGVADLGDLQTHSRFASVRIPARPSSVIDNVSITSLIPSRPLRLTGSATPIPMSVRVALRRSGSLQSATSTITLKDAASGITVGEHTHQWDTGENEQTLVLTLRSDMLGSLRAGSAGVIASIDSDANERDNSAACVIRLRQSLRVGIIDSSEDPRTTLLRPSRSLRAALAPSSSSPIELSVLDPMRLAPSRLAHLDALFVLSPNELSQDTWNTLANANRAGLVLIFTPQPWSPSASWTSELGAFAVSDAPTSILPSTHDPARILSDELPASSLLNALSSEYAPLARSVRITRSIALDAFNSADPVAQLADGSPFAISLARPNGSGAIILLAAALDLSWTDLPTRPLFVPMMQELVRQSIGRSNIRSQLIAGYTPSDDETFAVVTSTHPTHGRNASSAGSLNDAGFYAPLDADGAANSLVALNADTRGSDTSIIPTGDPGSDFDSQLATALGAESIDWINDANRDAGSSSTTVKAASTHASSAVLFLIAALLGLIELTLARVFSFRADAQQSGSKA